VQTHGRERERDRERERERERERKREGGVRNRDGRVEGFVLINITSPARVAQLKSVSAAALSAEIFLPLPPFRRFRQHHLPSLAPL
jgi:hypothetical protein